MSKIMWDINSIDKFKIFYSFSNEAAEEVKAYTAKIGKHEFIDQVTIETTSLTSLIKEIKKIQREVDEGQKFVVLKPIHGLNYYEIETLQWIISKILGETIVQNEDGRHLIHIFDRDPLRRIKDGARYHQTHETGAIHTDNVNIPENYQYLLVGCVAPAMIGGENIIVNAQAVYEYLKENAPKELEMLMDKFTWEYRGISRELYEAPIITIDASGDAQFRHLRVYMESAHLRANKPLNQDQVRALDALDATLNMSCFQLIYRLQEGEILIANDSKILHDRKCFVDSMDSISINEKKADKKGNIRRSLLRTWVRKL
ncbi:MAG: TauD/TfdA family dioxygenase [Bacteriovorax sp.]|nr:TauD/TfdA family dioxygenase [Bacteriovorax sp.]